MGTSFEFFEHNGQRVPVEIRDVVNDRGASYVASLLADANVRFEAPSRSAALEKLVQFVVSGKAFVEAAPPVKREPLGRAANILVLDDNPQALQLAVVICQTQGHQAMGVRDGQEALAWLQSRPFDLVLTDVHMPGIGGLSLVQWLRKSKQFAGLPIIAVTAAGPNSVRALEGLGVDQVVKKPYTMDVLVAAIEATIGRVP